MNVNFGLFPPLAEREKRRERKPAYARRALADLDRWLDRPGSAAA
jgi:methylenetetrahydrofolate--tRNA-(uracil-5-)-methyltransferase